MNIFRLLHTIDGILNRLTPVAPLHSRRHGGTVQWLFILETQDSYESELSRETTELSAPVFPLHWKTNEDCEPCSLLGDYLIPSESSHATDSSGSPLPRPSKLQQAFSVDYKMIQVLSGLRAYLLILVDSAALTCRKDGSPDPDFVGNFPDQNARSALRIMREWSEEDFVANAKYWKDWPLASFLRNHLPPKPASWHYGPENTLFSGPLRVYVTRCIRYDTARPDADNFYRVVYGIAQSKRGFATVPRSFVLGALIKHRSKLSSPPNGIFDETKLVQFVDILLKGFRCPSILKELTQLEASTRASVDLPRRMGGAREDLRTILYGNSPPIELIRMVELSPGEVVSEYGQYPLSSSDWFDLIKQPRDFWATVPETVTSRLKFDFRSYPRAKVAEVLEPLKVRLITAMDSLRTFVAKPLQQALWKHLRSLEPFKLIGEPVTEFILRDLVARDHLIFGPQSEEEFVSGDYSAATDGLDIRVSKVILNRVLLHLSKEEQHLAPHMRDILFEQVLMYPGWSKLDPVLQQNGQLMGSILSFPVLCIANLFTYVLSLPEPLQSQVLSGRLKIDRLPVLVNGDDILFRASDEHYERWLLSIRTVGFTPSVGKNFKHSRFFTVNSEPLQYIKHIPKIPLPHLSILPGQSWVDAFDDGPLPPVPPQVRVDNVTQLGYLNVGLLTGQAKLTGRDTVGALPLSGWHSGSVLRACNPKMMHKFFLHYHKDEIRKQTRFDTTLNIFAHPYLGGLGFTVPEGVVPRFSEAQRSIARVLYDRAVSSYRGQASDYPLSSLLFLESTSKASSIIGHRRSFVEVAMYPLGTPFSENVSKFEDRSAVYPLPLTRPIDPETSPIVSTCRMSNKELHRLTKNAFRKEAPMLDIESMTSFPFIPVMLTRESFKDGILTSPSSCWYPEDLPPSIVPSVNSGSDQPSLLLPCDPNTVLVQVHSVELWELPRLPLAVRDSILNQKFKLRSYRSQLERENRSQEALEKKCRTRARIASRREYEWNFYLSPGEE